jgi:oligosaccharide reducing-end xylanase
VLTGSGGAPFDAYEVLSSTDIMAPRASWLPVATNFFGADGSLSCTLPFSSSEPKRFYNAMFNAVPTAVGYMIAPTPTAPIIDGTVDTIWSSANVAAPTNVCSIVNNSYTNASQCSGTFQALYDATNLYVLVQVADDATDHTTDSTTYLHLNDAVEIYVDANNTKQTSYQPNDFHFTFSLVGLDAVLMMSEANKQTNGVVAAWTQTGTNADYVLEVTFPWSLLGQSQVKPGALLGFEVQIDHAYVGGARDFDLMWNCTNDTAYKDPSQFGTARLAPAP